MVGMARFELATFCPPDKRANQAALHPDFMKWQFSTDFIKIKPFFRFFSSFSGEMDRVACIEGR